MFRTTKFHLFGNASKSLNNFITKTGWDKVKSPIDTLKFLLFFRIFDLAGYICLVKYVHSYFNATAARISWKF
jgi:hypothetical protein